MNRLGADKVRTPIAFSAEPNNEILWARFSALPQRASSSLSRIAITHVNWSPPAPEQPGQRKPQADDRALTADDPEEVPGLIRSERRRLVLLDLMLPGTDGIELMERVRTADRKASKAGSPDAVPRKICSISSRQSDSEWGMTNGIFPWRSTRKTTRAEHPIRIPHEDRGPGRYRSAPGSSRRRGGGCGGVVRIHRRTLCRGSASTPPGFREKVLAPHLVDRRMKPPVGFFLGFRM